MEVVSSAPWSGRSAHSCVVHGYTIYIMGGSDGSSRLNDVWSSSDGGLTWVEDAFSAVWSPRIAHSSVVLDNKIYIMGGRDISQYNDVWCFTPPLVTSKSVKRVVGATWFGLHVGVLVWVVSKYVKV